MDRAYQIQCCRWQDAIGAVGMVDVTISDPPYDEQTHAGHRNIASGSNESPIDFNSLESFAHVAAARIVTRRWMLFFCSLEHLGEYKRAYGDAWIRSSVWRRHSGPQKTGDRPAQGAEGMSIGHAPGKKRWHGGGQAADQAGPTDTESDHPTAKPVWLMERLVRLFSDPGDTILDPFMGSGTTGVAALRLGRKFIGFEQDPKYFAMAERRLSVASEQFDLVDRLECVKMKQEPLL